MFGAFSVFSMIVVILLMVLMFKITVFTFKVVGKVMGWMLGIVGWLIISVLAVTAFGLTIIALPIILVVGLFSIIMAIAS